MNFTLIAHFAVQLTQSSASFCKIHDQELARNIRVLNSQLPWETQRRLDLNGC